jgi:hypothetical protein
LNCTDYFLASPYVGNYGDNALLSFLQYRDAQPGTPLYEGAKTGTDVTVSGTIFDEFDQDVKSGRPPQVSWLVPPEAYTEHPNWPANYGAWYVSRVLDILTENPDVWSKTAFFLIYDENDGFFDHMVPPTVPPSPTQGASTVDTSNEVFSAGTANYPLSTFPAGPYGLGPRSPLRTTGARAHRLRSRFSSAFLRQRRAISGGLTGLHGPRSISSPDLYRYSRRGPFGYLDFFRRRPIDLRDFSSRAKRVLPLLRGELRRRQRESGGAHPLRRSTRRGLRRDNQSQHDFLSGTSL